MTVPSMIAGLRLGITVAAMAVLGGCAAARYGSDAYDPVRMPGTAEVAQRTQYRGYNYVRPVILLCHKQHGWHWCGRSGGPLTTRAAWQAASQGDRETAAHRGD